MENFAGSLFDTASSAAMRKSLNEAYSALFEGLNPMQKTRREIRTLLPEPPGGWDSPAVDSDGNELRTVENGRPMNFAECLEFNIRNMFFHDGGRTNPKFEPGVARIAYTELGVWPPDLTDWRGTETKPDWSSVREFVKILKNISTSHSDDYDFTLNGMTFAELAERFAHGSSESGELNEDADGTGCRYNITWIPDFDTARKYAKYTMGTQAWCLTTDRSQWNRYMKGNTVKMYICTRPGFEDVPGEPGPNCPLDDYGLSMIGVSVNPDGSLDTCCSRWNHLHGGSDMVMDEKQLCKVLNVRRLSDVCPPYSESELENRGKAIMDRALELLRNPKSWDALQYVLESKDSIPGIKMYVIVIDGDKHLYLAMKEDGTPLLRYLMYDYDLYGNVDGIAAMAGRYNPNADTWEELLSMFDDGSLSDWTEDHPYVFYSAISGKVRYMDGESDISGCTISEVLVSQDPEFTYDYPSDELNRGIALEIDAPYDGTYLFDTTTMDFVDDLSDGYIDSHVGNMLVKDNSLLFVSKKGIVDYGKVVYGGDYSGVEMFASNKYHDIIVEPLEYERTGNGPHYVPNPVAVVDPITGELKHKVTDVVRAERVYDGHGECVGVALERNGKPPIVLGFDGTTRLYGNKASVAK